MANVSGKEVVKALLNNGWERKGQKGDDVQLKKREGGGTRNVTVPLHKNVKDGTLKSIMKSVGFEGSISEFQTWVKNNQTKK